MDSTIIVWPLLVYFGAVILVVGSMLGASYVLGERHHEKKTGEPYESGMPLTGSARLRFDVKFYAVAMFFVIFDIETAIIFGWAVAVRELGWPGYIEAVIFIVILVVALVYLWRIGALEWGTSSRQPARLKKE